MTADEDSEPEERKEGAPHGITLFDHAEISAAIAEGDRPVARVLAERDLTEEAWNESTLFWMGRIGDDALAHGKDARLALIYGDAFAKAQDARRAVLDMTPEAYAALVVDIQRAGGPAQPLASRGLSTADYLRLSRLYASRLTSDPEVSARFASAYEAHHAPAQRNDGPPRPGGSEPRG